MRTYTYDQWHVAQLLWIEGDFSDEWKAWRHEAAMRAGIIFPPEGSKWDSWEDDQPSQRAMLVRAMRETPTLLHKCIPGSRSWGDVIEKLLRARDDWRERMRLEERAYDDDRPTHRESVMALGSIIRRIGDSA